MNSSKYVEVPTETFSTCRYCTYNHITMELEEHTVELVCPGINRLAVRTPTLPPATHTNSFLIGTDPFLLVEPASPYESENDWIMDQCRTRISNGCELRAIVATHFHPDHVGGAKVLCNELNVPFWGHAKTIERIGFANVATRTLDEGDEITLGGDSPIQLQVLHTPGHAPDHLCFWEPNLRTLIAGDMVASVGTILIEPDDGDMIEYLGSLHRLLELDAQTVLPAHGAPVQDAHEIFTRYIAHRLAREAKVQDALTSKLQSLEELVAIAYRDTPQNIWPIAQLSLHAHLIKLQAEKKAEPVDRKWRFVA